LALAVIGITFGIVASVNSSKANKQVQDLIANTFIAEESQKFLFDNLKNVITQNRKAVKALGEDMTYSDYSLAAANTRMHILSKATSVALAKTEFKDIVSLYIETKETLDSRFVSIVNVKDLSTKKKISKTKREDLIDYHKQVISSVTSIIKGYTATISFTKEVDIKK